MAEGKRKTYVSFDAGSVTLDSGLAGVKLDFNYGARVLLPDDGEYRVRFTDLDTSSILYDAAGRNAIVTSTKNITSISGWKSGRMAFLRWSTTLTWRAATCISVTPWGRWGTSWPGSPTRRSSAKSTGAMFIAL